MSLIGESGTIRSGNGGKASGEAMLPQCPLQSASDKPKEKPTAEEEALGRADSFTSAWLGLVSREADLSFVPEEVRVSRVSSVVCLLGIFIVSIHRANRVTKEKTQSLRGGKQKMPFLCA